MSHGNVTEIYIATAAAKPMNSVQSVRAIAGLGLEGDRYYARAGTFSHKAQPDRQVTFIESEAVEAVNRDYELALATGETRRNIVTSGIALNHLVGREFSVGSARFRGIKLCEPCGHLEKLTREGIRKALLHRGGLRAEVLEGGTVSVGDTVTTK
jgi:MOSC domain-containing protein YiiM